MTLISRRALVLGVASAGLLAACDNGVSGSGAQVIDDRLCQIHFILDDQKSHAKFLMFFSIHTFFVSDP